MSRPTTEPSAATNTPDSLQARLREGLAQLRPSTRELLSSLKNATAELRHLALATSPFAVRAELIAHGLAAEASAASGATRYELTALGLAALELSQPLSADARGKLAAEADRALAEATSEPQATESSAVDEASV